MTKKTQSDDSLETESKDISIDLSDTFFGNADKINQENIAKKSQSIPLPDVDHHRTKAVSGGTEKRLRTIEASSKGSTI